MIFVLGPTNIALSITLIKMTVNFSGERKKIKKWLDHKVKT